MPTDLSPATSYADLYARFGNPFTDPDFEQDYIVASTHTIANGQIITVRSHVAMVEPLHDVFEAIQAQGLTPDITEYDGCYVVRSVRGFPQFPSLHSWGLAIDICASKYPLGSTNRLPHDLIMAFKNARFFYGGDFKRPDPMHFQYAGDI